MTDSIGMMAASLGGAKLAQWAQGGSGASGPGTIDVAAGINKMNSLLSQGLDKALNYSQIQTNAAVGQENKALGASTNALNNALTNTTNTVNQQLNSGLQQYIAAQSPYASAGYGALDQYQDSLGLSRPTIGSQGMAQGQQQLNQLMSSPEYKALLDSAQKAGISNPYSGVVPNAPTNNTGTLQSYLNQVTPQQVQQYLQNNQAWGNKGVGAKGPIGQTLTIGNQNYDNLMNNTTSAAIHSGPNSAAVQQMLDPHLKLSSGRVVNGAQYEGQNNYDQLAQITQNYLAQHAYDQSNQQYQKQLNQYNSTYNPYTTAVSNLQGQLNNMSPELLQAALAQNRGLFS